jgi:hypothetical protein
LSIFDDFEQKRKDVFGLKHVPENDFFCIAQGEFKIHNFTPENTIISLIDDRIK